MTVSKAMRGMISGSVGAAVIFVILLAHNSWGDDRYVLKEEAIREQIARIDIDLTIVDQEILYAETDKSKAKFKSIKAIYERQKSALVIELNKLKG